MNDRTAAVSTAVAAALLMSGCSFIQKRDGAALAYVGAEPLKTDAKDFALKGGDAAARLGALVSESIANCGRFMDRLTLGRGSFNYASDATASLLSAAAAIATPTTAARQLAAGSTVVNASKSSFDSEFYANATSGTLQTAIARTYFHDMSDYISRLARINEADVRAYLEIPQLQAIHSNCTLANAQSTVQATLQAAAPAAPASAASAAASAPQQPASAAAQAASAASGAYPTTKSMPGTAIQQRP